MADVKTSYSVGDSVVAQFVGCVLSSRELSMLTDTVLVLAEPIQGYDDRYRPLYLSDAFLQNNLRLEETFLTVDQLINNQWTAVRSDSHPSTIFQWTRTSTVSSEQSIYAAHIKHTITLARYSDSVP